MNQRRLSLNRHRDTEVRILNDVPMEISDDESFDSNIPKDTEKGSDANVSHTADILNNMPESLGTESSLRLTHDLVDVSSDDEDSNNKDAINKASTSNIYSKKLSQSLFNWDKTNLSNMPWYQNSILPETNTSHSSRRDVEDLSGETSNKRQKVIDETELSNDDDLTDLDDPNDFEKEVSPPKVIVHQEIMIAGTKVKFPVKPYPSQIAVMHKVNIMIAHD